MICLNFLCVALFITGFHFPESFCFEEHHSQNFNQKHEIHNEEANSLSAKPKPNEPSIFPRDLRSGWNALARVTSNKGRQIKDTVMGVAGVLKDPAALGRALIPSREKLKDIFVPGGPFKVCNPKDPEALLMCVMDAALYSLGPILAFADLIKRSELNAKPPLPEGYVKGADLKADAELAAQIEQMVDVKLRTKFIRAAKLCFGLFERDKDGKLHLSKDFGSSLPAELVRFHPIGALSVGTAEAIANSVTVKRDSKGRFRGYSVDAGGLATGLGWAVTSASKFGQMLRMARIGGNYVGKQHHPSNPARTDFVLRATSSLNASRKRSSEASPDNYVRDRIKKIKNKNK